MVLKHSPVRWLVLVSMLLSSCTYLKYSSIQAEYARIQNASPSQMTLKHMLDRDTFFVVGKTVDSLGKSQKEPMAVAAFSNKFSLNERVDTMYLNRSGTHFGLNLPAGEFQLIVVRDTNHDGIFTSDEVIGEQSITLNLESHPQKIVSQVEIDLTQSKTHISFDSFPVKDSEVEQPSLYFPNGAIRKLTDPIFDKNIATLGMYDPASFLEHAPTTFFALEEDQVHKIPVIFVHGIDDSPRAFETIISQLDRNRYKPWFFYYPSGGDLNQLAELFYNVFLSGKVISLSDMPLIVVAHSMGGLVVRESINQYLGDHYENKLKLFVSIASPLGGHPDAKSGVENGLIVLPAWRDLDPSSQFIQNLYRRQLPTDLEHHLFYAYHNSDTLKLGENSDGVVPLSSQLHQIAQRQSNLQIGFKNNHTDILESQVMIDQLLETMSTITSIFPEDHMKMLENAGLDLALDDSYDPRTKHLLSYAGKYIAKLISGEIPTIHPHQDIFLEAVLGKRKPATTIEKDFVKLVAAYPHIFTVGPDSHDE
jgi:uncharacterized alpha/beta hydrolase family protein